MELEVCIKGRRSVRAYTTESVSKEQIEAVLEAGTWAPTAMFREPLKFVVIEDKNLIRYISDETKTLVKEMMPGMAKQFSTKEDIVCYNVPVLVLVCVEKDEQWSHANQLDAVLATQNMFLKAYELGLGTCYMGFVAYLSTKPEILKKVGVPENYECWSPSSWATPKRSRAQGKERNRSS